MSQISERLLKSANHVGELASGSLLIKHNAYYPWFMIVPHGEFKELIDLPRDLQLALLDDMNCLSRFILSQLPEFQKVNLGAIGNVVPQFHLHVVGRHENDPAWPGPVWGHPEKRAYAEQELERLVNQLETHLPGFKPV
ncbi:MAG: HIT family protein [Verrucomicrobiota bacterium]